ncbi:MAG: YkgJ family cysteine cluster protein [Thermoplasmata archaeon]|nr:YkgJ family cysteine cluster protein [Thermoplasmata archaeon]
MEISYAFLTDNYRCLDGCAFCCLCEPEIPDEELATFLSDENLKPMVLRKFADGEYKYVIKLKNRHGACSFLQERKCTIYSARPLYCRLYPFQRHLSTRLQITANLSCRGLWENSGENPRTVASALLPGEKKIARIAGQLKERYRETIEGMEEDGVYIAQPEVQKLVLELLPLFTTEAGLEKILSFADGNELASAEPSEIRATEVVVDAEKYASEMSLEVFSEKEILNLPVYPAPNLDWCILRFENGNLKWYRMDEEGGLKPERNIELTAKLKPLDDEAKALLERYLGLLNERDLTYGNALLLTDFSHNEIPVLSNYLGALATSVLELWWRANLFAHHVIDRAALREGIIFYDADYLDKPTLGAVF